jgi:hypothetical protein
MSVACFGKKTNEVLEEALGKHQPVSSGNLTNLKASSRRWICMVPSPNAWLLLVSPMFLGQVKLLILLFRCLAMLLIRWSYLLCIYVSLLLLSVAETVQRVVAKRIMWSRNLLVIHYGLISNEIQECLMLREKATSSSVNSKSFISSTCPFFYLAHQKLPLHVSIHRM